jgi:hypothetical protein
MFMILLRMMVSHLKTSPRIGFARPAVLASPISPHANKRIIKKRSVPESTLLFLFRDEAILSP